MDMVKSNCKRNSNGRRTLGLLERKSTTVVFFEKRPSTIPAMVNLRRGDSEICRETDFFQILQRS